MGIYLSVSDVIPQATLNLFTLTALIASFLLLFYAVFGKGFSVDLKGAHFEVPNLEYTWQRVCSGCTALAVFALFLRLYSNMDYDDYVTSLANDLRIEDKLPATMINKYLDLAGGDSAKQCALKDTVYNYDPELYPNTLFVAAHQQMQAMKMRSSLHAVLDQVTGHQYCFANIRERLLNAEINSIRPRLKLTTSESIRVRLRDAAPFGATTDELSSFTPPPDAGYIYVGYMDRRQRELLSPTFSGASGKMPLQNQVLSLLMPLTVDSDVPDPATVSPPLVGVYNANTRVRVVQHRIVHGSGVFDYVYALVRVQ